MQNNGKVILYGRFNSVNVQKVIWVCEELKIPYDRVDAGGNFELNSKNPEYLKLNPNGLVPTINDNGLRVIDFVHVKGFILWESNAIIRYLVRKFGNDAHEWYPTNDVQRCAEIDKWLDWTSTTLFADFGPVFLGIIRTPKEQRNEAQIKACHEKSVRDFTMLNEHLKHHSYVAGDKLSIADLAIFIWVWRWRNLPEIEKPPFPSLDDYFERVKKNQYASMFLMPLT